MRTPWTLSSDVVWDKTNQLGGKLFQIIGTILLIAVFFNPPYLIIGFVGVILLVVVALFIYSYLEFRKLKKQ